MDTEKAHPQNITTPLWAMAAALWIIAVVAIVGSFKVYQMQESLRQEIENMPKIPKIRL